MTTTADPDQAAIPAVSFDTDPASYRHWTLDVDGDIILLHFLKSAEFCRHGVVADLHRREGIFPYGTGGGRYRHSGSFVGEGHLRACYHASAGVFDRSRNSTGIDLSEYSGRKNQG